MKQITGFFLDKQNKIFGSDFIMKKIFCLLMIILGFCANVHAETKLRVGYVPGMGFLEEDRSGHFLGYGYEYMEFLARYGDWKFEYVPATSWQELGEKLQSGAIDVLPAMPGDYRSLKNVTRTDHVVGRYAMALITHDAIINQKMRIGTIKINPPLPSLPSVAKNEGFEYDLVYFENFFDMEDSYNRRELDGYIAPMLEPNKAKEVAAIFDRQSYRLLVRSDRKDLLKEMNIAMDEMLMDQPSIRDRLTDKYLRTGGTPLILNRLEKKYLAEKKKLKTAILIQEKPYAYWENGQIQGVIPRVIKKISSDLNIEIEIVETHTPQDASNLIRQGKVDFVADAVCDFSWAENLNMLPTQSYLKLEYVPVTRRGINPENASVVACVSEFLYTHTYVFPRYPEEHRLYLPTLKDCFEAVSDGRADILFAPRGEVIHLIEQTDTYNLEQQSVSLFSDSLSLGVSSSADGRLWRILNKEVNHLDVEEIWSATIANLGTPVTHLSLQWQLYHNPLRIIGALIIFGGIILLAFWYKIYLRERNLTAVAHLKNIFHRISSKVKPSEN